MPQTLTVGSLFSGIGGFDLGFERSSLKVLWQVENNSECQRVLTRQFPLVERFDDVKSIRNLARTDVFCGGFPCQDLSVAGKRKGLAGERSGLWFEFLRVIESNLPRWIVIENVPGLLSSDESRDFATILRGLVNVGYCLAWRVLDAQYYGVAQRRRRVFIVGSLGDGSCAEILFESESVSWNPLTRREAGQRVASTITGGFKGAGGGNRPGMNTDQIKSLVPVAATLDQRGRSPTDSVMMNLQVAQPAFGQTLNHYDESQQTYIYHENIDGKIYESNQCPALRDFQKDTPIITSPIYSLQHAQIGRKDEAGPQGKGYQEGIAFTLDNTSSADAIAFGWNKSASQTMRVDSDTTDALQASSTSNPAIAFDHCLQGSERSFIHRKNGQAQLQASRPDSVAGGFGVRRLTPTECERLQGFPDGWTAFDAEKKAISDSARYRMLGNAVCVNVSEWIGRRLACLTLRP